MNENKNHRRVIRSDFGALAVGDYFNFDASKTDWLVVTYVVKGTPKSTVEYKFADDSPAGAMSVTRVNLSTVFTIGN